ncbi:hypothetical protein [Streptomyces sp. NPDC002088]|uniref:hypothetical protein n=1 Tax=Streptomyces sp. NPDC002088 TaxID=3154665 RepID=UPI00332203BA
MTVGQTTAPIRLVVPFDEVPDLSGREFRGTWFSVDKEMLPLFDHVTYVDQNPIPYDDEDYPEDLVEGFHLLSLLDHLANGLVAAEGDGWYGVNYGLDRVRFVTPVLAGTPIRLHGTVAEVRPKGDGHLLLLRCTVEVRGEERPGFTADLWVLWLPTHDGSLHRASDPAPAREDIPGGTS